MSEDKIQKEIEKFDKYRKEYKVESEPHDFTHIGLDSSFHFSDFKKDLKTFADTIIKEHNEKLKEEIEKGVDYFFEGNIHKLEGKIKSEVLKMNIASIFEMQEYYK